MRHRSALSAALATLIFVFGAGCGDDPVAVEGEAAADTGSATFDGQTDTLIVDDAGEGADLPTAQDGGTPDAADDTADTADAGPPTNCPGGANCPCDSNVDCDNALCIDVADGKACAQTCVDVCPSGFECKLVDSGATDGITICVPRYLLLCNPCNASEACTSLGLDDATCVAYGDQGAFCGAACKLEADCPTGFECKSVFTVEGGPAKQCVRAPDGDAEVPGTCSCSKAATTKQLSTECTAPFQTSDGLVTCSGKRTCSDAGLSDCVVKAPAQEDCNALDDDCDGQTDEGACDDANGCTTDSCTPGKGSLSCAHADLNQVPCDADGNACTIGDLCNLGVCQPGKAKNCDDGNPCSEDSCNLASGCTHTDDDGLPCDDENPCTLGDTCGGGTCGAGVAKTCTSSSPCLLALCDVKTGKCAYLDATAGLPCSDGNVCTGPDTCLDGLCKSKLVDCDDGNVCTDDSCDPKSGCSQIASTKPCDDGSKCTYGDVCKAGLCAALAVDVTATCDDGNPCTTDSCLPAKGCHHTANKVGCDDGNPCTKGDTCAETKCVPGTNVCSCGGDGDCAAKEDGNLCNGTLFCDKSAFPFTCEVNPKTVLSCDGGADTDCVKNTCQAASGKCAMVPATDGAACDADGDACTEQDVCASGKCVVGKTKICDDSNPCTADSCDAKSGACASAPAAGGCDDGDACTDGDTCQANQCAAGKKKVCDDSNPCTKDSCDAAKGCVYAVDVGHVEACYTGKAGTEGKGTCKGGQRGCSLAGELSDCEGQVVPAPVEACEGKDDDCDGATDESCGVSSVRWSMTSLSMSGGNGKIALRGHGGRALGGRVNGAKQAVTWRFSRWLQGAPGK